MAVKPNDLRYRLQVYIRQEFAAVVLMAFRDFFSPRIWCLLNDLELFAMTTSQQLEHHSQILLLRIAHGVSGPALDQLVANVSQALTESFANGDQIKVAGTDQRLTTRLQVLSALNGGYAIEVDPASSTFEDR